MIDFQICISVPLGCLRLKEKLANNFHLCINGINKLRDNWIFKALLWMKKSFKSVDFDQGKVRISLPTNPIVH